MERRSQGAVEYMLLLSAVLLLVAGIVVLITLSASSLGSEVGSEIDNVRDNLIIPGLIGAIG